MAKKMKGAVALDLSPYVNGYGDSKVRLKHHNLLQDYQDLRVETDALKNQLETAKQRKLSLLGEVRFLRQRYKYLSEMKSVNSLQERQLAKRVSSDTQKKLVAKDRITKKKDANLRKLPPLPNSKKGKINNGKEASHRNATGTLDFVDNQVPCFGKEAVRITVSTHLDYNHKDRVHSGNEAAVANVAPVIDLNQSDRVYSNGATIRSLAPALDLNHDSILSLRGASLPSRAPIFDLNEISTEEDDVPSNSTPLKFEELKRNLMRGGSDEQLNDLSLCRTSGEGPSRVGKRKISWQDPVALRV